MKGLSGSGKSTLARALGQTLSWPVVDKDDIRDVLPSTDTAGALAYQIMWRVVRCQLLLGQSVIADSPLTYAQGYATVRQLAQETHAQVRIVECVCPDEELWRERINQRKLLSLPDHHQIDWEAFQRVRASTPPSYLISDPILRLHTNQDLALLVGKSTAWLGSLASLAAAAMPVSALGSGTHNDTDIR
jgi:predicted kinase